MSAYGDITCEWCGAIYNKREVHICGQNAVVELKRLRQQVKEDGELIEAQKREILVLQGIRDEAEALRQRVDELEDENKRLKLDVDTCSETLKISEQERIRLQKAGHAYRDRMREATTKYKERGERIKAIKSAFDHHDEFTACSKQASYQALKVQILLGFDPETGEPL